MSLIPSDNDTDDTLYKLLPAIHRARDAALGSPLRGLLRAISDQATGLSEQIARQYENWFIETCDDDLVPLFADLVALSLGPPAGGDRATAVAALDATWRRRQVADALADRRRKGTFSVLEQLAFDATGWPGRVLEVSRSTLTAAALRYPGFAPQPLVDTGDGDALETLGTPFGSAPQLADVRRLSSTRTTSHGNPASVAVWLWRLIADTSHRQPAAAVGENNLYTFDALGRDVPLCVAPVARRAGTDPAGLLDVPTPISRLSLARRLEDYYGSGRSICVYRGREPIPRSEILVADLGHRRSRTPPGRVSIDPERGRIAFPERNPPQGSILVNYARLGIGAIGGGSYTRPRPNEAPDTRLYRVSTHGAHQYRRVGDALEAWHQDKRRGSPPTHPVIEITDDGVYEERFEITLSPGERLEIRAARGRRPILIPQSRADRPDQFRVSGPPIAAAPPQYGAPARRSGQGEKRARAEQQPSGSPPVLVLDGIWIAGYALELAGQFSGVELRHCTLVPSSGWARVEAHHDRRAPSLLVRAMPCPISITSSVLGRVRVESPETGHDPLPLLLTDSVLDAGDLDGRAISGSDGRRAWASLSLRRVTVLGGGDVDSVELVEDSILTGPLNCERRQTGTVRFSYLPAASRTPRRTSCQPDEALAKLEQEQAHSSIPEQDRERTLARESARLTPRFDAVNFGQAAYARVAADAAPELRRGAHDEGELGAYHDLWQALRAADLRKRLHEFAPVGTDIDIRFAT